MWSNTLSSKHRASKVLEYIEFADDVNDDKMINEYRMFIKCESLFITAREREIEREILDQHAA